MVRLWSAVDEAKGDLPSDLPNDPKVSDINLADLPIMYINLSGDYDLKSLKKYAEDLQDRIESFKEISMGMSSDYKLAIAEGSTMVRIGSSIFGKRVIKHYKAE